MDNQNRPIKYQKYHKIIKDSILNVDMQEWWKFNFKSTEEMIHVIFPFCSKIANNRIDKCVIIMDFEGVDVSPLLWSRKLREYFELPGKLGQECYPEVLGQLWMVNVPYFFSAVWKFITIFLSKGIQKKIRIFGKGFQEEICNELGGKNLPVCLGGEIQNLDN